MEFKLREWRMEDARSIAAAANNPRIACNLRDGFPHPYTLEDAEEYIRVCMAADPANKYMRAVEVDGTAAGSVGVFRLEDVYRKSAEIGYFLGEAYWGRGIMHRAVAQACKEAFAIMDIVRIHAGVYAPNAGSRRVLEKCGFVLEGVHRSSVFKNGVLLDSCTYALCKEQVTLEEPLLG